MKKENQRVKLTRQLLQNSLIRLMGDRPIGKISVKEICLGAEINRSTFYLYYKDPYTLLEEIENEVLARTDEHLEKIGSDPGSVQYLSDLLGYIRDHAELFRVLLNNRECPSIQPTFVRMAVHYLQIRLKFQGNEKIAGYANSFLVMGCLSVITRWIDNGFDMPCEEMAELIFNLSDKAASQYYPPAKA